VHRSVPEGEVLAATPTPPVAVARSVGPDRQDDDPPPDEPPLAAHTDGSEQLDEIDDAAGDGAAPAPATAPVARSAAEPEPDRDDEEPAPTAERHLPAVDAPTVVHRSVAPSAPRSIERTVSAASHVLRAATRSAERRPASDHHASVATPVVQLPAAPPASARPTVLAPSTSGPAVQRREASAPAPVTPAVPSYAAPAPGSTSWPPAAPGTPVAPVEQSVPLAGPVTYVQRQDSTEATTPPPAAEAPPGAPAPGAAPTGAVLTPVLFEEIYERIEQRMRGDLLFDRERKGQLADVG
jgi:hypothetical protein